MTTNTVGDNAWIGLWQVPNKFRWQTNDASYFEWAATVGVPPTSKRASDVALREVVRFGATYPVYVTHLALHRFLDFVNVNVFNGVLDLPARRRTRGLRGPAVLTLMAVVVLCLTLPHEARRTLFLGWPLLFNLPLFLLFFSDGMRHVAPCTASLLVSAVPPLLEAGFYRMLGRRRRVEPRYRRGVRGRVVSRTVGRSRAPRLRPPALLDAVSRPRAFCLVPALTIEYLSPVCRGLVSRQVLRDRRRRSLLDAVAARRGAAPRRGERAGPRPPAPGARHRRGRGPLPGSDRAGHRSGGWT